MLRCHPQPSELSLASKPLLRELSGKESRLKENGNEGTVGVRELMEWVETGKELPRASLGENEIGFYLGKDLGVPSPRDSDLCIKNRNLRERVCL